MKSLGQIWFILGMAAILVSCAPEAAGRPSLETEELISPAAEMPAASSTEKATPTETSTITPTATLEPTSTGTTLPTAAFTPMLSPIPDWIVETVSADVPPDPVLTLESPDQEWVAEAAVHTLDFGVDGIFTYTMLRVVSRDGLREWLIAEEVQLSALGMTIPRPLMWSRNAPLLYYVNGVVADGCGIFVNAVDLFVLDVTDGSSVEILPPYTYSLAVGQDDSSVAYTAHVPKLTLVVLDRLTGVERRALLDTDSAGAIIWSPDGSRLALTFAMNPCASPVWTQAVAVVEVPPIASDTACSENADDCLDDHILLDYDERLFTTVSWPEPGRILLVDGEGGEWWLDVETGLLWSKI